MGRKIGSALLFIVLLAGASLAAVPLILPQEVIGDGVSRQVDRVVLCGKGEVEATLSLAPALGTRCGGQARPLDIALLVDVSSSMKGKPMQQAVAAADAFIRESDLGLHRLALFLFSGQIEVASSLTDDRVPLRAALANAGAQDGTAIDIVLRAAREELTGFRRRLNAGTLILLLSDGGSDPQSALHEAELAAEQGIQIAVVGLHGDDFNEGLLRQLASSPGAYRPARLPEELSAIYADLVTQINRLMATDVVLVEPVGEAFQVMVQTATPPARITSTALEWRLPWLVRPESGSASEEGPKFMYRVQTSRWGLHRLVPEAGEARMVDCTGTPVRLITPVGPRILVLPPWPLIVLPLALSALLGLLPFTGLLGRLQRKRLAREPKPEMSGPPSPPKPPVSPPSPQLLFERWLNEAESWSPETGWASASWLRQRPVLFVGLGDAGKEVLMHLANYLRGRWGELWPRHVRLLHIGVSELPEQEGAESDIGFPSVVLCLDRERRRRLSVQQAALRLGAADESRLSRPGRAFGPLAALADLAQGKVRSRLWSALVAGVGDLKDLSVYVMADTFSDEASGMIADVGHLLRQVVQSGQIGRMCLYLAAQHSEWRDELSQMQREERTFATLRELQRLERASNRFSYAPGLGQPQLDALSPVPLFDEVFLFDGIGEEREGYRHDLSQLAAKDGLLPAMAGSLIALLDPHISQRFYQDTHNQLTLPVRRGQLPLETRASAMGSYALRLPVEEMRQVVECRLVHKCLFDRATGLIRWEELNAAGQPQRRGDLPRVSVGPRDAEAFFDARKLSLETAQHISPDDFCRHLTAYLETKLNSKEGKRLRWARQFVALLRDTLPSHADEIARVEQALQSWVAAVGEVQATASADPLVGFLGIGSTQAAAEAREGPLYRAWAAAWENAREIFARSARMHGHRLLWKLEEEFDFYMRYLEPGKPWERMQRRLWWRWADCADRPELHLVILPDELDAPDPEGRSRTVREAIRRNPVTFARPAEDAERIMGAVLESARLFSRVLTDQRLPFKAENADNLAAELVRKASCLYRGHRIGEGDIAVEPFYYFSAPDRLQTRALAQAIQTRVTSQPSQEAVGTFHFHFLPAEDATECRLLHVQHVLPLRNMEAYVKAKESYTPRADLHVFRAEQVAARWEEQARREVTASISVMAFSPRFVDLLAGDEQGMRLFGQCIVYGLIQIEPTTLHICGCGCENESLENLLNRPVSEAVEEFLNCLSRSPSLAGRLRTLLTAHRPSTYAERVGVLDAFREAYVAVISQRDDPDAHDLALLLRAVLRGEEQGD